MLRTQPLIGRCHWRSIPKIVKGRKDYHCCECNVIMSKGTKHQYISGIWGNSNLDFRTCPECCDRWDNLIAANPDFDFTPFNHGDLNEAIAVIEFQAALEELDRDRLAKAIRQYEPFAYGDAIAEIDRAKEKVLRMDTLSELVAETERLGLYELTQTHGWRR